MNFSEDFFSTEWYASEFKTADLGDERLNSRLINIVGQLSNRPESPINQAAENFSEAKGAYRFFKNESFVYSDILEPHVENTVRRVSQAPIVLAIQDTTYLNYSSHPKTEGLGHISRAGTFKTDGPICHSVFCVSPEGLPLGLLDQKTWARAEKVVDYHTVPIEQKESFRWLESLEKVQELTSNLSTKVVTIGDRESDIYEFLLKAEEMNESYVIRASRDRSLFGVSRGSEIRISDYLHSTPVQGVYSFITPKTKRKASLNVKFAEICLCPPRKKSKEKSKDLYPLIVNVIQIREEAPPKGCKPIEWTLITNLPVTTFEEAIEKVKWYSCRWHIENFHKVLKSGFRIETCRLGTADRLEKYIAICSVLAWRTYLLTHLHRVKPDEPCTAVLTADEWKALWSVINKSKNIPTKPPSIRQATRWIAQLGGFLGRKGDGSPGVTTIWRGWKRLADVTMVWGIMGF